MQKWVHGMQAGEINVSYVEPGCSGETLLLETIGKVQKKRNGPRGQNGFRPKSLKMCLQGKE